MQFDKLETTDQSVGRQPDRGSGSAEHTDDTVDHFNGEGAQGYAAAEADGDQLLPAPNQRLPKVAQSAGRTATQAAAAEAGTQGDGAEDGRPDATADPEAPAGGTDADDTNPERTADAPDRLDEHAETHERRVDQEEADRLFDDCSSVAAHIVGPAGSADIPARNPDGKTRPEPGNRVGVYAQSGYNALRHPDIVEVDFGPRAGHDETQSGPSNDWIQIRREPDGRITVQTSEAIANAPRRPDGSIELPEPSDDPGVVGAAFNRVQTAFNEADFEVTDTTETTLPPDWPVPAMSPSDRFVDAMGTARRMDASGKGMYVNSERAGVDSEAYSTRITSTAAETDSQGRARDSLRFDFEPTAGASGPPISVTMHHNYADGAVTVEYSPPNAADLLGFNSSQEAAGDEQEGDRPLRPEEVLDMASGALGLEDFGYQALVGGTSRLEQAFESGSELDDIEVEVDVAEPEATPLEDSATDGSADAETTPAAGAEGSTVNGGEATEDPAGSSPENQAAATSGSKTGSTAETAAEGETVTIEDVTDTAANGQVLRQAGMPSDIADAPTNLLQLTGRAVGQLFTSLRERVEVATIRRETEVVNVLTLIDDAYHRVDLIETNAIGEATPTPTQYYLRSTLRHEAEQIVARAQGRNFQAAAGALGTRALMQSLADTHRARVIARTQRTAVRYQAMAARQRMGVQRQRLAAAAPQARGNGADRHHPQAARIQAAMRRAQHVAVEVPRFHSRTRAAGRVAVRGARGVARMGANAARIYLDITTGVPSRPQRTAPRRAPDAPVGYERSRSSLLGNTQEPNQSAPGAQPASDPTGTPQPVWQWPGLDDEPDSGP